MKDKMKGGLYNNAQQVPRAKPSTQQVLSKRWLFHSPKVSFFQLHRWRLIEVAPI